MKELKVKRNRKKKYLQKDDPHSYIVSAIISRITLDRKKNAT